MSIRFGVRLIPQQQDVAACFQNDHLDPRAITQHLSTLPDEFRAERGGRSAATSTTTYTLMILCTL